VGVENQQTQITLDAHNESINGTKALWLDPSGFARIVDIVTVDAVKCR
jgi:hypothetical protein